MTALSREESKAQFPEGVEVQRYSYDDPASIVEAMRGQEFLVISLPGGGANRVNPEIALVRAAAEAGVPYVMPNAFAPDCMNEKMLADMLVGAPLLEARREIESLGVSSWVALSCGFWWEWSLLGRGEERFGCGLGPRTMTFFDDGEEIITSSTWDQCGRAVAALVSLPRYPADELDTTTTTLERWANKPVYISSFRVNQKDMFACMKRVTGTTDADWKIEHISSQERYTNAQEALRKGIRRGFSEQMYTRIFFPTGEGDHARLGLANEALGLPEEDIDQVTRDGLQLLEQGLLTY